MPMKRDWFWQRRPKKRRQTVVAKPGRQKTAERGFFPGIKPCTTHQSETGNYDWPYLWSSVNPGYIRTLRRKKDLLSSRLKKGYFPPFSSSAHLSSGAWHLAMFRINKAQSVTASLKVGINIASMWTRSSVMQTVQFQAFLIWLDLYNFEHVARQGLFYFALIWPQLPSIKHPLSSKWER